MQLAVIVAIVIAVAGVLFAVQNSVPSTVVFFLWRFDGSLGVILLLALALGALIVALVTTPTTVRANWVIKRQNKEIDSLKTANAELRTRAAELERQSASGQGAAAPGAARPWGLKPFAAEAGTSSHETEPKT